MVCTGQGQGQGWTLKFEKLGPPVVYLGEFYSISRQDFLEAV